MDYNEKLRLAKEALASGFYDKETIEYIFPELKESEDERIRKELISFVRGILTCHDKPNAKRDEKYESWIAWLEKQGEKKSEEEVDNLHNYLYGEQNPAWSEEDEKMLKVAIESCEQCGNEYAYYWLKSLKERYTWKPSDEEMKALNDINATGGISYIGQGQELTNLYKELKKLKG